MKEIIQQYSYHVISDNKQWLQQWKTWKQWEQLKERTTCNTDYDDAIVSKESYISINGTEIILGKWPTWCTILFYVFIFLFLTLYMFRAHRAHHQERQIVSIQPLVAVTVSVAVSCSLLTCTWHAHRHRVTATRGCIDTICLSWWWTPCTQNMWRVKNKNKYKEKKCASCWSFTKNHYMMHGQQNIKFGQK